MSIWGISQFELADGNPRIEHQGNLFYQLGLSFAYKNKVMC